jgi:flagellar hook-associated protein 1 FlgK
MPGVGSVLSQAKTALAAAQIAMNTTARNVANVNTEGYARQRVDFQTGTPEVSGAHRVGGGVEVKSVTRTVNDFLQRRISEEATDLGSLRGMSDIYKQLELVFKEEGEAGVSGMVSRFFNDLRTLSTQPDSVPLRAAVRESAIGITNRVQNLVRGIDQVREDIDRRVEGNIVDLNEQLSRIGTLNRQISEIEGGASRAMANDERDARDMAIKKLSTIIDVNVIAEESGSIIVSSKSLGPLVVGSDASKFAAYRGPSDPETGVGGLRVYSVPEIEGASPKDVTERISGGSLSGFLKVRDDVIPEVVEKIDHLAFNLSNSINSIHSKAYNRNGTNGVNFFQASSGLHGAAAGFSVSSEVQNDLLNIASADAPNSSADNKALLRMTDLQQAPIFEGGTANFVDLASSIVGKIGAQARSVYDGLETQDGLFIQLETFNKEVSGVSLDEEAMDMLKFQKAFDANAKMIQVADSMMETVLNLRRF